MDIEKRYSIGFYPEWDDPAIEKAKEAHPSNRWAQPIEPKSTEAAEEIGMAITQHKRSALMRSWILAGINGDGIDTGTDTTALAHALYEFGSLSEEDWPDDDLTTMLDGSLRAIGYENGIASLGRFDPAHSPLLMSAAFAITAGNAMLLFDEQGKPVVRTNVRKQ
jgi:hypothetical protein